MNFRKTLIAASIAAIPFMTAPAVQAESMMSAAKSHSAQDDASLIAKLMGQRGAHGLGADHGFAMGNQHPGMNGTQIARVDHTFKGVRVFSSESVVVTNNAGDILSESVADRRSGLAKNMNVNPSVSAKAAIDGVVAAIAPNGVHLVQPSAELIIFPVMTQVRTASAGNKADSELNAVDVADVVDHYELAYLVHTRMSSGSKAMMHDSVVSATSGSLLDQWSMMHTVVGTGNSQYNGVVPIQTTLSGSSYTMLDTTRGTGGKFGGMAITDAAHSSSSSPTSGNPYTNSTNVWGDGKNYIAGGSDTNANGQTAAVNALWGLMNTYDGMKNVMGWASLDGKNTATYIAVHVGTAYDNAFYTDTCKCMYIGDGSSFYSLGSIDVIGHEMGHGVTAATSNLTYRGESGGLNESSSDINGEMIEAYARAGGTGTVIPAGNDWMMGVEISKTGQPLRWMWKPSKDGASADAWSKSVTRLDVHNSSGPNNRMFYFLSQGSNATSTSEMYSKYLTSLPHNMTGIGNDKAYRIWFNANTTKFTSATNYADARLKMIASAEQLYGVGSKESTAVKRAYAAINVGADVAE
jgi:Zn-dependent metalloprotease